MKITGLFFRSYTKPFYQAHAGFFFILLYVAAGLLRGTEHIFIAKYTAKDTFLTLIAISIWSVYILNSILYIRNTLTQKAYWYMRQLSLYPASKQFYWFSLMQLTLNLPVTIYTLFILTFTITLNQYVNAGLLAGFTVLSVLTPPFYYMALLKKTYPDEGASRMSQFINKKFTRPYPVWYFSFLLGKKPLLLLLSKAVSLAIIAASFLLYGTDDYDWRILGLGVLLGFNGNMVLMFDYFQFERKQLPVFRNLPFTFFKRISYQAIAVLIISIPEYFVMLKYFPHEESVLTLIYLMIYGSVLTWMFLQIMMLREMPLDKIGKIGFYLILIQLLLILANTPLLIMILIMGIFIGWVQLRYYRLISN